MIRILFLKDGGDEEEMMRGFGRGNGRGRKHRRGFRRHASRGYPIRNIREVYLIKQQEQYIEQHKEKDLANKIYEILPKLNCRACGHNSCMDCANAIANGEERYDACRILKPHQKEKIREVIEGNNRG